MSDFTRRRFIRTAAVTGASAGVVSLPDIASAGTGTRLAPSAAAVAGRTRTLTFSQLTNGSAAVAPAGDELVVEVQGVLWSLPRRGGTARQLTDPDLEPTRPAWSPDGRTIAMAAYRGGGFHIWTMAPDGTALRQVTEGPWDDRGVSWSPDSARLAFASERGGDPVGGTSYHIFTVAARGGTPTRLTEGPADDYDPAWSADGRIVFARAADAGGARTIASVPAAGGEVSVVRTVDTGAVVCPTPSPDGRRIAYVHLTVGENGPLADLLVDGRPITSGEDVFAVPPRWLSNDELLYHADGQIRVRRIGTPSMTAIPFTARLEVERPRYRTKEYDFDGTDRRQVRGIGQPAISPDGRSVAFTALNALWLMDIPTGPGSGGGRPRRLVQAEPNRYVQNPAWAPDGRSIVYTDDRDGLHAVRRRVLADGSETTLATGMRVNPALSPDGTLLACHDANGNLLVRDLATGTERQVAAPIGANGLPGAPSWSPDGRHLATTDRNRINPRFREGYNLIRVVDTLTGRSTLHPVADHMSLSDRYSSGPVWSPDGRWMAFVSESALWVLPVRTDGAPAGQPRRITDEPADHPSWAGDSGTILYLSGGRLRTIRRDGGGRRTLEVPLTYRRKIPPESATVRIHAGRLWDGTGGEVRTNVDIVVRGNRIAAIEPHRGGPAAAVRGERYVDASRHTVLPGLWDSHTHPWLLTYGGRQAATNSAYGITTTVSLGGFATEGVRVREAIESGQMTGPRLLATGELIDGDRVAYSMGRAHRTRDGLRRTLERAVALDFDFVKTYVRAPGWIMREAAEVARELGVRSGSHLCCPGINVGQDLTTHLQATQRLEVGHATSTLGRAYQDLVETYAGGDFQMIATPFGARELVGADPALVDDPRITELYTPWDLAFLRDLAASPPTAAELRRLEIEADVYRRVLAAGGAIALGTDSPLYPLGLHLHLGMRALHRYGIPIEQILRMVTVIPAKVFGVDDDLGTVQPGKLADLVMVDGNPFEDFSTMVRTTMTMRDGLLQRQEDIVATARSAAVPARAPKPPEGTSWLEVGRMMRRDGCCADEV
jgi:Tol biopolymer transport system component